MGEQPGDDQGGLAGVGEVVKVPALVEPFQEEGAVVGGQEPCRAVAVPGPQRDRLAHGLVVHVLEFEHGGGAVRLQHGEDQSATAAHRRAVGAQVPLLEEPFGTVGEVGGHGVTVVP
jgi:hypothetical protein